MSNFTTGAQELGTSVSNIGQGLGSGIEGFLSGILNPFAGGAKNLLGETKTETTSTTTTPNKTTTTTTIIVVIVLVVLILITIAMLAGKNKLPNTES